MTLPEEEFDPFFGEPEEPRTTLPYAAALWTRFRALGEPEDYLMRPVTIEHRRDHKFVKKPDNKRGCALCGAGKTNMCHVGAPKSLNAFGSGANIHVFQGQKKAWMECVTEKLEDLLPKGLGGVEVTGVMGFDSRRVRDQGNYRFMIEKAVGDALKEGGWIEDDDWTRYEFSRLAHAYERGESWVALTFHPRWETERGTEEEPLAAQGTLTL